MIACDGGGNWRSDNASESCHTSNECSETVNRSNYVFISMNGRPTDPPYVHNACPTRRGLDNRLDRFDASDENYLIGYYATYQPAFTSSSVVWRGIANGTVDPLPHRNYFTTLRNARFANYKRLAACAAAWDCCSVTGLTWIRFSAAWVGRRSANLIRVSPREIKPYLCDRWARPRFPFRCVFLFSFRKNFIDEVNEIFTRVYFDILYCDKNIWNI